MEATGLMMKKLILDNFKVEGFNKECWGFFIFPDGQIAGSDTHLDMLDLCYDMDLVSTDDYNYYGSNLICEETAAIRLAQSAKWENYIELNRVPPTGAQYERLLEFLDQNRLMYSNIYLATNTYWSRQVKYEYQEYLPEEIIKRIKRYYSSGNLYEEFLDEASHKYIEYNGFTIERVSEYGWTGYFINNIKDSDKEFKTLNAAKNYINQNKALLEASRASLIADSRSRGLYKDQTRGKNRFERKKYSKVANSVKEFNQIDMNKFFKEDTLEVKIPIIGETSSYEVTIKVMGTVAELARLIKLNQNKFEFGTVLQAVTKVLNSNDVYIHCSCPDHKFTYDYWNIVKNVSTLDSAQNPGPGRGIRNPKDEKGRGCKHSLLVLTNLSWVMKVAAVINNYIHYAEEKMPKPFANIIFPKLYGQTIEDAIDNDLIDDEKFLDSSTGIIDAINEYGKSRGRFQKGSNKNPISGTGGRPKTKPAEDAEAADENQNQPK